MYYWITHVDFVFLNWVFGILFAASIIVTLLGLFASQKSKYEFHQARSLFLTWL